MSTNGERVEGSGNTDGDGQGLGSADPEVRASAEQLLEKFAAAVQTPPPGPGGVIGIGPPWSDPPPMEPWTLREASEARRKADLAHEEHEPGAKLTWLVLVGMCALFLLLTLLIIVLPYGRQAHTPPIWVY